MHVVSRLKQSSCQHCCCLRISFVSIPDDTVRVVAMLHYCYCYWVTSRWLRLPDLLKYPIRQWEYWYCCIPFAIVVKGIDVLFSVHWKEDWKEVWDKSKDCMVVVGARMVGVANGTVWWGASRTTTMLERMLLLMWPREKRIHTHRKGT